MATIRLANEQDAESILAIYAPFVRATPISFEVEMPSAGQMQERIRSALVAHPWLVCERDERVIGYAYASRHRERMAYQWSVDVTVYVDPATQRAGVGRALYTALLELLGSQGFFNAFAGIALPNAASVGLHESLGFKPIGVYRNVGYKLGRWHDVGWWQRALRSPSPAPVPPLPLDTVRESSAWQAAIDAGMQLLRSEEITK
jgi:L-amino acid N-acyltransferase YncA